MHVREMLWEILCEQPDHIATGEVPSLRLDELISSRPGLLVGVPGRNLCENEL